MEGFDERRGPGGSVNLPDLQNGQRFGCKFGYVTEMYGGAWSLPNFTNLTLSRGCCVYFVNLVTCMECMDKIFLRIRVKIFIISNIKQSKLVPRFECLILPLSFMTPWPNTGITSTNTTLKTAGKSLLDSSGPNLACQL